MRRIVLAAACALIAWGVVRSATAAEPGGEFARTTIDLGMVVSDVDKAVKFYTEAIGFKEIQGFTVSAEFCAAAGLTDKQLDIRVLVLGDEPAATRLKVMSAGEPKSNDNRSVTAEKGFRYLTIYTADANATAERLKKAGVKPLAKGPVPLPPGFPENMRLSVVRDPDGNLVELIGPVK